MKPFVVKPSSHLKGNISLIGDKSIAHRSVMIGVISLGKTLIENFPVNKDCLFTIRALKDLGAKIKIQNTKGSKRFCAKVTVGGVGLFGLRASKKKIFVGNSGTTLRMLLGILAGQPFRTSLIADRSLSSRPMLRVTGPLRMMGALISSKIKVKNSKLEEYPPIVIKGGVLRAITYRMPVASAQVKSAILLAGLYAAGETKVIEPIKTRDHTERMLRLFGAEIKVKEKAIVVKGSSKLHSPKRIYIPGDFSSAAFFMVLGLITPGSTIWIERVSLNPSRLGLIRVLKRMKASIVVSRPELKTQNYEPMGNLTIKNSLLKATTVRKEEIPSLIDELPILMVAACYARGMSVFEGVQELRVKETDRIRSMCENLRKMGADITIKKVGSSETIIIKGTKRLMGARVKSFQDHRSAMSLVVAGMAAEGPSHIDDISCIDKSFPNFLHIINSLKA